MGVCVYYLSQIILKTGSFEQMFSIECFLKSNPYQGLVNYAMFGVEPIPPDLVWAEAGLHRKDDLKMRINKKARHYAKEKKSRSSFTVK